MEMSILTCINSIGSTCECVVTISCIFMCIETPPSSVHLSKLQDTFSFFFSIYFTQCHSSLVGDNYSQRHSSICACVWHIQTWLVHTHTLMWMDTSTHKKHPYTLWHQLVWSPDLMGRIILAPQTQHPTKPCLQFLCWGLTPVGNIFCRLSAYFC